MREPTGVSLVAKLKDAYLNLELYTPEDIRSLFAEAIQALREKEHVATVDFLSQEQTKNDSKSKLPS